ncbi:MULTISPECIES: carbohydrate ABC transporter permease [unclassified Actinomyces]|uniref:carbohydrate ABC transporter permease n=1 Tax=unclassified Actinomyces TaxID=2609248 RepID=UPI0020175139|nr:MULTISPECIES: carbohydrate ABC transporter permease [unclassified Actinomyces]MCL3777234.1 carbohydrate ABC transporter permease [Actinomyces sp. AC-20-1]MCL3790372.1 carbohydrate ABC transporter permease [Actinomyces sp. 187325]MCL3792675.1 carbohydrate ABC transporter permease [Actinomyces sp. 186855]MCL3795163.1 carbohydrate ABC transporter permease [Actinomyces sp. 217892]
MSVSRAERALTYVVLLLFALQALVPVLYVLLLALGSERIGDSSWGHVENFATAWEQGHFSQYMTNSVLIAVLVVSLALVLSLMSGYVLGILRPRGANLVFYVFLIGIMVPSEAIVLPLFFDMRVLGLTDTIWAVALPQTAQSLAFGTFWMRAFFRGVDPAILEAARIDGATDVRILVSILLPIGRPAVVTQVVLTFMWTWNDFLIPLVMSPSGRMRTAPLGLAFFQGQYTQGTTLLAAGAVLVALPMVLLYLVLQKQFISGMTDGAVKG